MFVEEIPMMKRLLVLTAVVMLTAATLGCRCDWFRRGALLPTATPDVTVCDPCPPCNPCSPCDPSPPCDPCAPGSYTTSPSMILPGPGPVTPSP